MIEYFHNGEKGQRLLELDVMDTAPEYTIIGVVALNEGKIIRLDTPNPFHQDGEFCIQSYFCRHSELPLQ